MTCRIAIKIFEESNPHRQRKVLIVFDDSIADMITKHKHDQILTELFIRGRKLNSYIVFIT